MYMDPRQTLIVAILVLFLGRFINAKVGFLRDYNIPEPVTGGLLISLILSLLYVLTSIELNFDMGNRDMLLIVFFTSMGLSSKLTILRQGGKTLVLLLVLAVAYLLIQNLVGIAIALGLGQPAALGLLTGSISLSGGHGTTIAWAPVLSDQYGLSSAMEIGLASATFGLILGGLLGGPIAHMLVKRHGLKSDEQGELTVGISHEETETISVEGVLNALLIIAIAIGLGLHFNRWLGHLGVLLPDFVSCLFAGIVMTNTLPGLMPRFSWPAGSHSLALVSDLSLGLFLSMSLMSMQLWTLADLAGPMLILLLVQAVLISLYTIFVVFRVLGKDYEAAVICSGYAGLALGATPTAMANMTAVAKSLGPARTAFIVVPLVGAFFIDISNAVVVNLLLGWFY